jgi:hypothetical protein
MRGIVAILVTLAIAGIVGVGAYELGVQQGLVTTGTAVAPAVYYYHPFFFGGFLGFLFPLFFLFLIFGLVRAAFGGGWGRRYGGWGGHGYYASPRERFEELHRELHGEKPKDSGQSGTPPTGR